MNSFLIINATLTTSAKKLIFPQNFHHHPKGKTFVTQFSKILHMKSFFPSSSHSIYEEKNNVITAIINHMKPQFDILFSRTEKRVPFCGFECSPFLYPSIPLFDKTKPTFHLWWFYLEGIFEVFSVNF